MLLNYKFMKFHRTSNRENPPIGFREIFALAHGQAHTGQMIMNVHNC